MRIAVFTLALLARIASIEWYGGGEVRFGDGPDYLASAAAVCTEGSYPERGNLPFFRAPGLPLFIAAVTACDPGRVRVVKYGLAVCDALSVLLIASIAMLVWQSRKASLLAGTLAALHPFFWGAVADVRSEPLFMLLFLASLRLMLGGRELSSGIALGVAALTRPTGLLCIPLFALFAAIWKKRPAPAVVFVLSAMAVLAPWTARNYLRFGEVIVVNDAAGFSLWRGTHPETLRVVGLHNRGDYQRAIYEFETVTVAETSRIVDRAAATPRARDREWRRLALDQLASDPAEAARTTAVKAILFWRPWLHPLEHDLPAVLVSFLVTLALYAAGFAGLALMPDRKVAAGAVLLIVAMWAAHVPYVPTIRLRAPIIDPLMVIFAAGALSRGVARRREDADADIPHRSGAR